jgi:flagellar export protein FliJ
MRAQPFRLSSLLRVRRAERDQRQLQLGEALAERLELDARRGTLERQLDEQRSRMRAVAGTGRLDLADVAAGDRYMTDLRARLAQLAEHQQDLSLEIDRRRQALVEADRQLRVLENLHKRQQAEHRREQSLVERKLLDEAALRSISCRPIAEPEC